MVNNINVNEHFLSGGVPTGILVSDFCDFVSSNLNTKEAKHLLSSFLVYNVCGFHEASIIHYASDLDRTKRTSVVCDIPEDVIDLGEWKFFVFDTDGIISVEDEQENLTVTTASDNLPIKCTFDELQTLSKKRAG